MTSTLKSISKSGGSVVETHLLWEQDDAGSNPAHPTRLYGVYVVMVALVDCDPTGFGSTPNRHP